MNSLNDRISSARLEQLVTAIGLSIALAGLFTLCASALGWVEGGEVFRLWLILIGVMVPATRRLSDALAPLFWLEPANSAVRRTREHFDLLTCPLQPYQM